MADNKGGSDLDVFEGLAKKSTRPASSGLSPPVIQPRQRTLLGGLGGMPPPSGAPGSAPLPPPPPPVSKPPSGALPPPLSPPAQARSGAGTLPPVIPPPTKPPGSAPLPPLQATPLPPPPLGTMPLPPPMALPPPVHPPAQKATTQLGLGDEGKARAAKAPADMDWDDEDESTHVYDKQSHDILPAPAGPRPAAGQPPSRVSAAAALLASSGGTAAPALRPSMQSAPVIPSAPPLPPAVPAYVPTSMPSRRDEATAVRPRPTVQSGGSKVGLVLVAILVLVVLGGLAVFFFIPRKGQFTIDVKAPDGVNVARVEVFIDGQKRCDTVPCVVRDLEPGSKTVKVIAPDFPPRDAVEVVEAGKEKAVTITLEGSGSATSSISTGLKASGSQTGVKVFVDGTEKGTLPAEIALPAGTHKIRFDGGDRYERVEQSVEITEGQVKDLGNISLKVLKGQVTLDLVTAGASVTLVNAKRVEKRLPDALWKTPPVKLDIDPSEGWKLVASKKGYEDFVQPLTFEDGQADKTVRIELSESGKAPPATASTAPAPTQPAQPSTAKTAETPTPPTSGGGNATLNINSIPVSKVVLDGRPLGSTPKVGVSVSPGSHTVTFIHPEYGKKSQTVTLKAGETKTAAVKFK